jgi:hypothetical protein
LAFSFFVKVIGEGHIFSWLSKGIGEFSYSFSSQSLDKDIENSAKFLVIVLVFMLFGMVMFTIIPRVIERVEEEPEDNWDE